ncbi:MAG: hypothetical protein Q4A15_10095 [Prevotellaceae bacterium]|nr:hypothetical protein [Prevotellaceae bacterium]
MDEIDKAWKEHFELTDKLDAMKKAEKAKRQAKPNKGIIGKLKLDCATEHLRALMVQLETFAQYAIQISKKHEELVELLDAATYVVDHGNIGSKRSRMTFPHDFQGAKQYFDYAKDTYDWTELLMSVNINYNENYIKYKREQEKK